MVRAHLWADRHRDCNPLAIIEITEVPLELHLPGDFGLEEIWKLRHRFIPATTNDAEGTADYEFGGIR